MPPESLLRALPAALEAATQAKDLLAVQKLSLIMAMQEEMQDPERAAQALFSFMEPLLDDDAEASDEPDGDTEE